MVLYKWKYSRKMFPNLEKNVFPVHFISKEAIREKCEIKNVANISTYTLIGGKY